MAASFAIIFVLLISVVLNVFLFMRKNVNPSRSIRSTILTGIQNVNELATVRSQFQSIVNFSDGVKIPWLEINFPGTTKKFMMKYHGTIVCGCDLSKAQVSDRYDLNRVRITLPHSKILDVYADVNSFEIYDQRAGIFTSIKLEDQNREVNADLEKVKAHELQNGILEHSDNNVRKILTSVVASTGMEAEILFTDEPAQALTGAKTLELEAASV